MDVVEPRDAGMDPARLHRLEAAIRDDVEAERWDGCALVASRHGRIVFRRAFGWADRAAGRPIAEDQVFVTMSIGKQFTVAHVLTHTAGLPAMLPPMAPEQVGNLEAVVAL